MNQKDENLGILTEMMKIFYVEFYGFQKQKLGGQIYLT